MAVALNNCMVCLGHYCIWEPETVKRQMEIVIVGWLAAVWIYLCGQSTRTYHFRYVFAAKVNVKCCKLSHQCTSGRAVAQIFYWFDGWKEVGARCMQCYTNWCIPSAEYIKSNWQNSLDKQTKTKLNLDSPLAATQERHFCSFYYIYSIFLVFVSRDCVAARLSEQITFRKPYTQTVVRGEREGGVKRDISHR